MRYLCVSAPSLTSVRRGASPPLGATSGAAQAGRGPAGALVGIEADGGARVDSRGGSNLGVPPSVPRQRLWFPRQRAAEARFADPLPSRGRR